MKSIKFLVAIAVAVFCNVAVADPYITLGIGKSTEGSTKEIGVGFKTRDWLRTEINYHHFQDLIYDNSTSQFQFTTRNKVQGLEVSALLNIPKVDWVYLRGGLMYYKGHYDTRLTIQGNTEYITKQFSGISSVMGIGITLGNFSLERTGYHSGDPIYGKMITNVTTVSLRIPL